MSKLTYEQAVEIVKQKGCTPCFTKDEWFGINKDNKKIKYWFKDVNGHKFYKSYSNVVYNNQIYCNTCSKLIQNEKQKLSYEEYIHYKNNFIANKHIKILTDYSQYKNRNQKLQCQCLLCNKLFDESISNIFKKYSHGCIKISKGELLTMSLLEENQIDYIYQVYIPDINLTSDFEIKLLNGKIIHLEIDGDQHYEYPNEFHKTYEDYLKSKDRDVKKDNWYLNNNNINIHIRYNVGGKKNDDLISILNNIINGYYGKCNKTNIKSEFNILNIINKSNKNKKVIAYTLDGKFYKIYENIISAENDLKVDNSCISECLYNKRNIKRAGNYIFKLYSDNYPLTIDPYKFSLSKPVLIFKSGIFIEELYNLSQVQDKYKIHKSTLSRYLTGKNKTSPKKDYDFKYKIVD